MNRSSPAPPVDAFRHQALLYAGNADFLATTTSFIRDALAADEPTLVVVSASKIDALQRQLGRDADSVHFADMAKVGANPARIMPAWRDFVSRNAGADRRLRGIGEPISAGCSPADLAERQRHESLLNVAFAGAQGWWLLCPYDTDALDLGVIEEARRSHPFVKQGPDEWQSGAYRGLEMSAAPFDAPLSEPAGESPEHPFEAGSLAELRSLVSRQAAAVGLGLARTADLVLAVNEVATNSLRHGGGAGVLRTWHDAEALICEIRDRGHVGEPLVGRERPPAAGDRGQGLWLANQLCDLVQLRSFPTGTVVRLHMRRLP